MAETERNFELVVKALPGAVETNLAKLKDWITAEVTPFLGATVLPETMKDAKDTRAYLNKLKGQLEDKRKSVKKQLATPYDIFKEKYDDATALLIEHINSLDVQIKKIEDDEKAQKLADTELLIDEKLTALELDEHLAKTIKSVPSLRNSRWENKGYTLKKISKELDENIESIRNDLMSLSEVEDEFFAQTLQTYKEGGLSCALLNLSELKKRKEEAEALKETVAKERETTRQPDIAWDSPSPTLVEPSQTVENEPTIKDVRYSATFTVEGTKEDISRLKQFIIDNNMTWNLQDYKVL